MPGIVVTQPQLKQHTAKIFIPHTKLLSMGKLIVIAPILRAVGATVYTSSALLLMARVQKSFQRSTSAVLGIGLQLGAEA